MAVNSSDHRINNFNLLRMLAAVAVLVSHAYPIAVGIGTAEPLSNVLQMSLGSLAVYSFFVISGFFISQSFANSPSFVSFCIARVLRIYPGLLVVLVLTVLLVGPLFTKLPLPSYFTNAETLTYIPRNLTLKWLQYQLPGVFVQNPYPAAINGSLWSLFYEVVCYGIVAAVGFAGIATRTRYFLPLLLVYVAGYFALKEIVRLHHHLTLHAQFVFLQELTWPFVLGTVIYHFRSFLMTRVHVALGLGTAIVAVLAFGTNFFREAFIVFWGLLLFYLGYLSLKPLRFYNLLGDYSYGMYIYAFPAEQVAAVFWPGISPTLLIALSTPASLVLAALSWHFVEKPAMARRSIVVAWLERSLVPRGKVEVKSVTRSSSDSLAISSGAPIHGIAKMVEATPSLRKRFRSFIDTAPKDAREIGWRWMIGDRVLRRLRVKEIRLKPRGLDRHAFCRVATSDIYEYQHLLGSFRDRIDLPLPVNVAIDAGANVGYSALRLRLEFPGAMIIALEPEQSNITQFKKNCGGDPKIVLEEKALWSRTTRLRIRSMTAAANGFQVDEDAGGDIPAISMKDLLVKYRLAQIDLLKIDVEGSEKCIFGSPEAALWLPQVHMILVETHDRVEPGCSEAVSRAVNGLFEFRGYRGEYSLYVRRSPGAQIR